MPQIPVIPSSHIPPPLTTVTTNTQSPLLAQSTTNNALPYNPHCIPSSNNVNRHHPQPPKPPTPKNGKNLKKSPPKSNNKNIRKSQKRLLSETKICKEPAAKKTKIKSRYSNKSCLASDSTKCKI